MRSEGRGGGGGVSSVAMNAQQCFLICLPGFSSFSAPERVSYPMHFLLASFCLPGDSSRIGVVCSRCGPRDV